MSMKTQETQELLTNAYEMVKADPVLLTMVEMRSLADNLCKALKAFCAKAEVAQWAKRREYVRLIGVLESKRSKSMEIQFACKKLKLTVPPGKDRLAKLTLEACKSGKAEALAGMLERSPEDILRERFRDLAQLARREQRETALNELLKGKKLQEYAKALGFQIVKKTGKTGKQLSTTDRSKTLAKALEKLEGYAETLADIR